MARGVRQDPKHCCRFILPKQLPKFQILIVLEAYLVSYLLVYSIFNNMPILYMQEGMLQYFL